MSYCAGDAARAMSSLMEAVKERDEARGNCHGTWGYFGARYEDRVQEAEKDFISTLREALKEAAIKS